MSLRLPLLGVCLGQQLLFERFQAPTAHWYLRWLDPEQHCLVRVAGREQGLITARGNPLSLRSLADLARPGVRFVNRQAGSGTRMLLEMMLAADGPAPTSSQTASVPREIAMTAGTNTAEMRSARRCPVPRRSWACSMPASSAASPAGSGAYATRMVMRDSPVRRPSAACGSTARS